MAAGAGLSRHMGRDRAACGGEGYTVRSNKAHRKAHSKEKQSTKHQETGHTIKVKQSGLQRGRFTQQREGSARGVGAAKAS